MIGDSVQLIKDRLNIIDVISPYVELHKAGRHFKGKSPFTNEKTPSFFVSPERGMYYCFSTSQGGDIFRFIEVMEGVDFKGALKILAEKAGVELVPENPQKKTERDQLYAVLEQATQYFENKLASHGPARAYLENRSVTAETIKKWRIGYAPGPPEAGWRELRQHLNTAGYNDTLLLKAGLIKTTDVGKEPFDVFRDRVMFPLRDQNGKVVAFSGRILAKDTEAPKYVNSPETDLYHKSDLLYGYDMAKHSIRQLGFWLIVEGQFDVVMSHQAGYSNTVAVSGTALTTHHVQLLERLSNKVVLALDADKAGIAAMKRAADLMLRRGIDVKVAALPDGADPADMVQKDIKVYKNAVGHSVHVIEFLLTHLKNTITDERAFKLRAREEVIPFVTLIPNHIDQEHFEGVIATALGTTKDAVHFEVTRLLEESERQSISSKSVININTTSVTSPYNPTHRKDVTLLYLLAAVSVVSAEVRSVLEVEVDSITNSNIDDLIKSLPDSALDKIIFQLEESYEKSSPLIVYEELVHKLEQLRRLYLDEQLALLRSQLTENPEVSSEVLPKILELQKKKQLPPYTVDIFSKL